MPAMIYGPIYFLKYKKWGKVEGQSRNNMLEESHQLVVGLFLHCAFKEAYGAWDVSRLHPLHPLGQRVRVG